MGKRETGQTASSSWRVPRGQAEVLWSWQDSSGPAGACGEQNAVGTAMALARKCKINAKKKSINFFQEKLRILHL